MRSNTFKSWLSRSGIAAVLLFAGGVAVAQQAINLTAAPAKAALPDGSMVPMWGYQCGAAVAGSTATCAALNKSLSATQLASFWSPVVITVPTGQDLTINLTNNLSFTPTGATAANLIPTSLTIVGQLGGGLGTNGTKVASQTHATLGVTWPTANPPGGPTFIPPPQPTRTQSFGTEVAPGTTATALCWGVCGTTGGVALKPGTYLIESGTHPSIQGPMGLYGILVVTTAPTTAAAGLAYGTVGGLGAAAPVNYSAEVALLLSEIDPLQNTAVSTAVSTAGFSELATRLPGGVLCGPAPGVTAAAGACYPPAVNYTPLYYLFNGVAFDKTHASNSQFAVTAGTATAAVTGNVLVRLVNAGLHMHVPAIVGATTSALVPATPGPTATAIVPGFSLIAEDGNKLPGVPKTQSEVFMAAGKTVDVMIQAPAAGAAALVSLAAAENVAAIAADGVVPVAGGFDSTGYAYSATQLGTSLVWNGQNFAFGAAGAVDAVSGATIALTAGSYTSLNLLAASSYGASVGQKFVVTYTDATTSTFTQNLSDWGKPNNYAGESIAKVMAYRVTYSGAISTVNTASGVGPWYLYGYSFPLNPAKTVQSLTLPAARNVVVMATGLSNGTALPIYDRELSLSGNAVNRDAGMLAYIGMNGAPPSTAASLGAAMAVADTYPSVVAGQTLTVADPSKGVIANDKNVYGVTLLTAPTGGTLTLNANGTFTYVANAATTSDTFTYCANGSVTAGVCSSGITALVTLGAATVEAATNISVSTTATGCATPLTFTSNAATYLAVKTPGVLKCAKDAAGYPLKVAGTAPIAPISVSSANLNVVLDANGGFTASATVAGTYTFTFQAQNSQGTLGAVQTATLIFPAGTGPTVTVLDGGDHKTVITDYRWVIEEDRTFYINPNCTTNPPPAGCPTAASGIVPTFGVNFHTSYMPFVAQGCTGPLSCESGQKVLGVAAVCDVSNGLCRTNATQNTAVLPSQVHLDPTKRYYISVLPGDSANPFGTGYAGAPSCTTSTTGTLTPTGTCGHGMGGAPIGIDPNTGLQAKAVTVLAQPSPYPAGQLSVIVFEDDFPLNGEQDAGGGVDVLSPYEPGLGGFQIHLWDAMGQNGDFTGQMTYDMFNQPLTNSLDGTIDPSNCPNGVCVNACPITAAGLAHPGTNASTGPAGSSVAGTGGITGMIVTCPKYEADGTTLSPLAGQALIANLMPGRFGVIATPAADRIARGEEWLQTNTLDGQKAHDSFVRIGEPSYFQEFGPASYHVSIGFANPALINARHAGVCAGTDLNVTGTGCTWVPSASNANQGSGTGMTIVGRVVGEHLSRTPDERLYGTGSHDTYYWTQCYVSFGDPDGEDFVFTKCAADGTFTMTGLPTGDWRVTTFDQWNDMLVDGLSTPVGLTSGQTSNCPGPKTSATVCDMGDVAATQWETNLYTRTFIDANHDGISQAAEDGIPFANVAVRMRDGSLENLIVTDFTGTANFNETFPLFSWYVVETDYLRYKNTGTHVVYDVGGPVDGTLSTCGGTLSGTGYPLCGTSAIGKYRANTMEQVPVPANLRIPGSVYCAGADCAGKSIQNGSATSDPSPTTCATAAGVTTCTVAGTLSSGRIDSPFTGGIEGWQGFPGQNNFMEFGKEPYVAGENGGIKGHVVYASTRPFDDPQMLVQTQWEPLIPNVTLNLYKEGFAADGVTPILTLVDTTQTSSWDNYAQGFRADGVTPNMNCPGQGGSAGTLADLFFFSLFNQPDYLDLYNNTHSATTLHTLPYNSQFKCYDGMHNWNQIQPVPYDGVYQFPSVTATDPVSGKPTATNCTICQANNLTATTLPANDLYYGLPQLPAGKYVVEVVVPPGMELVKEEDKNILIGDSFIAPVAQQFGALGNIFIVPDQASVAAQANAYNLQNPTQSLGAQPNDSTVPAFTVEPVWPCVGEARIVPDYISLYPQTKQVAPFAGAKRNLCDRKEVTLGDQVGAIAKFFLYTSTHIASKFTGGITDDYTSEFDPFSPQFGEKFAPPDLPVSVKDWAGNETNRVYADHWGAYNGLTYSTWEVNPPNPTGYSPTMMVFCMNDPGPILDTRAGSATLGQNITDPAYSPGYSQFCYELPFMPGSTQYLDTPVVPTSAFAGSGYNNVDCAYPDATPGVASVVNTNVETGTAAATGTSSAALAAGKGPWVSAPYSATATTHTLTITSLGNQMVPNHAYSGPSATTAPFNAKTIQRHYGFGAACSAPTATSTTCNTATGVLIGAIPATVISWTDTSIVVGVPAGMPNCAVQQQTQYGAPAAAAQCGELTITAGNGKKSIDAVTVTVGGKTPSVVASSAPLTATVVGGLQSAINAAAPGDLLLVPPGTYNEMVILWKPLRLQGVGAASSIVNANTHPAGKLTPWRAEVNCLYGLSLNGRPNAPGNPFDPTGAFTCGFTAAQGWSGSPYNPQVDRLPLEGVLGWDTSVNGNLAQLLQEPTLMGAYEGAGITVLGKGVNIPVTAQNAAGDVFGSAAEADFPAGSVDLTAANCATGTGGANPYPSNFLCNPSSIDGLSITDSSQGGGGIFVHAWGHNLQIANNRIYSNTGTLTGGITVGQGDAPDAYLQGETPDSTPGSCQTSGLNNVVNSQLPYCFNLNLNVHNNAVTLNSAVGDELFSSTPAGGGGVTFCTGADYYKFQYNWVCGNLSSGDGGGMVHLGFIWNGDIEHNSFLFNQSTNPTVPTNGGGLIVMGAPPDGAPIGSPAGTECGSTVTDVDCTPGLSDGIGPGLFINANLIMGNTAESGTGGGIAFQNLNGSEVVQFPTTPAQWNSVRMTNNIVADNVAGWDGGGISLEDALSVNIINNTIISNSTTATSGVLFNALGAPLSSQQGPTCKTNCGTISAAQAAGIVVVNNSAVLSANLAIAAAAGGITCPVNHYQPGTVAKNGTCTSFGYPELYNNLIWQNSAYYIGVGALTPIFQQNVVTLYNAFTTTVAPNQPSTDATTAAGNGLLITGGTGACVAASYWDIGVRGDTGPGVHTSGVTLAPYYSLLTNPLENGLGTNNLLAANPAVASQYCDGARQPPEFGSSGWAVPPGISDATVPNPIFNLTPVATVDEGNNWINLRFGPLSLSNDAVAGGPYGNYGGGAPLGNYSQTAGSPVIDYIPSTATVYYTAAPSTDFFGNPRKGDNYVDVGAVEFAPALEPVLTLSVSSLTWTPVQTGQGVYKTVTVTNTGTGTTNLTITRLVVTGPNAASWNNTPATIAAQGALTTCTAAGLAPGASCTFQVLFEPLGVIPAGGQAQTATLTVTSDALNGGNTGTIALAGTAEPPIVTITAPGVYYGVLHGATVTKALTITNSGYGPIHVTVPPTVLPESNSQFVYTATGSTCVMATAIAVGGSCVMQFTYTPAAGTQTSTASLAEAAWLLATTTVEQTITQSITLTGTTVSPTATVTPATLAFGNVSVGATSAAQNITVTNTTPDTLTIPVTATVTGAFTVTPAAGCAAVASGANCTIAVAFKPTAAGAQTGTATVTSDTSTVGTVSLTGTGVAAPAINLGPNTTAAAPYNFGISFLGLQITHAFTLTNTGGSPLTISTIGVVKTNTGSGAYTLAGGTCAVGGTLAAGATCTVNVSFGQFLALGNTTGTVTVTGVSPGTTTPIYMAPQYLTGL